MTPRRPGGVPKLDGDAACIAALEETEQRLAARFPEMYRDFIANPTLYSLAVKHVELYAVARCHWLLGGDTRDEAGDALAIGKAFFEGASTLVFKVRGSIAREALYEWNGRTFRRAPDFSELVRRAHASTKISRDQRVLLAERLAGIARRCARCQTEIRVGQLCQCGHIGAIGDPKYVLSEEERATAQRDQAPVCRAWQTLSALKQAGAAVPTGSVQVLALADALVNEATSSAAAHALLATWQQKRMKVSIDVAALIEAIDRAAASS